MVTVGSKVSWNESERSDSKAIRTLVDQRANQLSKRSIIIGGHLPRQDTYEDKCSTAQSLYIGALPTNSVGDETFSTKLPSTQRTEQRPEALNHRRHCVRKCCLPEKDTTMANSIKRRNS
ncbi:hypothetical protein CSKR_102468 [Clonorchis sinensis]|uniref:Uncharacterized protein n=1 Tax=Clonorchis sinensis TaxID=79923 RepID=A0A419QFB4_CLOSI|nr:hypothetical protein CSKR_102468 [Clonorchis sinensis]